MNVPSFVRSVCLACASAAASLALWTLWLALSLLAAAQAAIALNHSFELPSVVRSDIEQRLEASGLRATFGRTRFDPSGRILIENVALSLPGVPEPIVTARAVYARVNPLALLARRFEPRELRIMDGNLRVPAMFAPAARSDEGVRELDAVLVPHGSLVEVPSLSFRLGPMTAIARGSVHLDAGPGAAHRDLPVASFLAGHYPTLSREFAGAVEQLDGLDRPELDAELVPSPAVGALVKARIYARGFKTSAFGGLSLGNLRVSGRFPLLALRASGPLEIEVRTEAGSVGLAKPALAVRGLRARIFGRLGAGRFPLALSRLEAAADAIAWGGYDLGAPLVSADLGGLPRRVAGRACASVLGSPVGLDASADLALRTASVRFDAAVAPAVLDLVGARLHRNLGPYLALTEPGRISGAAGFGPGWKFQGATGVVSARGVRAHGVVIDEIWGEASFDGRILRAPLAAVRVGANTARGSYEGDVRSRRYRFLLQGRLRPLDITPWFAGKWWPEVFGNFAFPAELPTADIDVRGRWGTDRDSSVFLFVDSLHPVIRGAALDRVRGRLFLRLQYEDVLEFHAQAGSGSADGSFRRRADPSTGALRQVEVNLASTVGYALASKVYGPQGAEILAPFSLERPPRVSVKGIVGGSDAVTDLRIEASTDGGFCFHDFPFDSMAFVAAVRGDTIDLDSVEGRFAGGRLTGRARVAGRGEARILSFDAALRGANLARAVAIMQGFRASSAPQPSAFLRDRTDAALDLSASAKGPYDRPLALQGSGSGLIHGSDLLQVKLLGLLSQFLNFTSLRFTTARATFVLNGPHLAFPSVEVTGANSAITARGTYDLSRHALDFNAKVFPFRQSKFLLPKIMNLATAPLSQVLEVKLTGSLDHPDWSFAAGPTNLLRGILSSGPDTNPPAPPAK